MSRPVARPGQLQRIKAGLMCELSAIDLAPDEYPAEILVKLSEDEGSVYERKRPIKNAQGRVLSYDYVDSEARRLIVLNC